MEINNINGPGAGIGTFWPVQQVQPSFAPVSARAADALERAAAGNEQAGRAVGFEQAVQDSVDKLNEFIRPYVTSLQFSVDRDLGKIVVKIMDIETREVIKQIPSEEVLALTRALGKVEGLLVKQKA